jgi:hypothetical protein
MLLFTIALSHAEGDIERREIRLIFTGNTVEGKIIKRDTGFKMYLHPSGKLVRVADAGEPEKGVWHISDNNALCLNLESEACYTINKRDDDIIDLYNQKGELAFIVNKVALGNPEKLKP